MLTPCLECGALSQGNHCPHHKPKPSPRTRPASSTKQGYGSDWQRVRIQILIRDHWTCAYCGKPLLGPDATVDHVIPIDIAPSLRLDPSNLVAACRRCNSRRANEGRATPPPPSLLKQ
jgi:5-methylcytosine-specific restriction endonuclease McrA